VYQKMNEITSQCRLLLAPPAASDVDMGATRVN